MISSACGHTVLYGLEYDGIFFSIYRDTHRDVHPFIAVRISTGSIHIVFSVDRSFSWKYSANWRTKRPENIRSIIERINEKDERYNKSYNYEMWPSVKKEQKYMKWKIYNQRQYIWPDTAYAVSKPGRYPIFSDLSFVHIRTSVNRSGLFQDKLHCKWVNGHLCQRIPGSSAYTFFIIEFPDITCSA